MSSQSQSSSSASSSSNAGAPNSQKTQPVWAKTLILFHLLTNTPTNELVEKIITPLKFACMKTILNTNDDSVVRKAQSDIQNFPRVAIDYYSNPFWADANLGNYAKQKEKISKSAVASIEPSITIIVSVHDQYERATTTPVKAKIGVWVQGKDPLELKTTPQYLGRLKTAVTTANLLLLKFSNIFDAVEFETQSPFDHIPCTHSLVIRVHYKQLEGIKSQIPKIISEIYASFPVASASSSSSSSNSLT